MARIYWNVVNLHKYSLAHPEFPHSSVPFRYLCDFVPSFRVVPSNSTCAIFKDGVRISCADVQTGRSMKYWVIRPIRVISRAVCVPVSTSRTFQPTRRRPWTIRGIVAPFGPGLWPVWGFIDVTFYFIPSYYCAWLVVNPCGWRFFQHNFIFLSVQAFYFVLI